MPHAAASAQIKTPDPGCGIQIDPASGNVFVSLEDGIGVLDPEGALVETIPVAGAGQIVIG